LVPVETTTRLPDCSAGTRYARVFPVPVPASTIRWRLSASADSTASAISTCPARNSYLGCHLERVPCREKNGRAPEVRAWMGMGLLDSISRALCENLWGGQSCPLAGFQPAGPAGK